MIAGRLVVLVTFVPVFVARAQAPAPEVSEPAAPVAEPELEPTSVPPAEVPNAEAAADSSMPIPEPRGPRRFRVVVRHDAERSLRLHVRERSGWHFVCATPCDAEAPFGRARLGLSLTEEEEPTELEGEPLDVTSDLALTLSLETRDTEHLVGGVLTGIGLALTVATLVVSVIVIDFGGRFDRAFPGSSTTGGLALLIALPGALTGLGLTIAGMALLSQPRVARAERRRE